MASKGPARRNGQHCFKRIVFHAVLLMMVVSSVSLDATAAIADTGIVRSGEKRLTTPLPKRKVGASSGFGVRRDPINKRRDFHKGIDISRPAGTNVLPLSDGTVVKAGWLKDYGYTVDILHQNGLKTRYAHLRAIHVSEGQHVRAGQVLGQIGRTGRTTGANLHFEIMVGNKLIDPREHLSDASRIVESTKNQGG